MFPRIVAALALSGLVAGCTAARNDGIVNASIGDSATNAMYGARPNERHPLPATDISGVNRKYLRQVVSYSGPEQPGTIVVDTRNRFLYLVMPGAQAMRYGIGVGKEGLAFEGSATIGRKAEWPRWTPTQDMIEREPERNAKWAGGMQGGPGNPLGPRALYLYQGGRDTLFRIHGTTEPRTIGQAVSSGCIRMFNQDIIDLYGRVPTGTQVVVLQNAHPLDEIGGRVAGYADQVGRSLESLASRLPSR